jgi:3-vinyl bacteriochlorophyllide hydratase
MQTSPTPRSAAPAPTAAMAAASGNAATQQRPPLYTPEQRRRRDQTRWTLVQGILAPVQFLVFLISLALVVRFLSTGEGLFAATVSVIAKTLVLYAIMITGAIWEKKVFDVYLFAPAFYWEDVFSMLVIALHTLYLAMVLAGWGSASEQMFVALAAYATYVVNATQFLLKLRAARLQGEAEKSARAERSPPAALSQGAA